jgi:SAM-dependent methyltransferase
MSALGVKILTRLARSANAEQHSAAQDLQQARASLGPIMPDWAESVRDKVILDMGSGEGWHALVFGQAGASLVYGIDIEANKIERSRRRATDLGLANKVIFETEIPPAAFGACDIVWSRDGMEHYANPEQVIELMKRCLRPGGQIYISFGPTWFSPYGAHMNYFLPIPWVHLFFSERSIMAVRAQFRNDGAQRYEEVPGGLNRMSVSRFERMIRRCGLRIVSMERRCLRGKNWLGKIPFSRELFINSIFCRLER